MEQLALFLPVFDLTVKLKLCFMVLVSEKSPLGWVRGYSFKYPISDHFSWYGVEPYFKIINEIFN